MDIKIGKGISLISLTYYIIMEKTPPKTMNMINIHSWNVRGLEMNDRKYIVRRWRNEIMQKDFICLQEIKVV